LPKLPKVPGLPEVTNGKSRDWAFGSEIESLAGKSCGAGLNRQSWQFWQSTYFRAERYCSSAKKPSADT
jgi:hypothetical protein